MDKGKKGGVMAVNIEMLKKEAIEAGLKSGIFTRFRDIEYIANNARLTGGNEVVFRPQFLSSEDFQTVRDAVAKIGDILPEINAICDELSRKG
jgi:hypothetical protein